MGAPYSGLEVASFMTCSKGYMGECGIRGGYAEVVNMDPEVMAMLQKSISAKLCPTVIGQACMDTVVNPPRQGDPSYESWNQQVQGTLASLKERAQLVDDTLNSIEGITCNTVQGALYAFGLLEATGICIIPGSGFGQREGTFHFRTTILAQKDVITSMLGRLGDFHANFLAEYKD